MILANAESGDCAAPMFIHPRAIISSVPPSKIPVFTSPKKRPTSVHVINGLSKFKRPNIRESILAKTAINPTTTAFNNILFPPQFYNFNSSLLVVGSCCIKTEVPQLIIFFVSSLSSSFK